MIQNEVYEASTRDGKFKGVFRDGFLMGWFQSNTGCAYWFGDARLISNAIPAGYSMIPGFIPHR